MIMPQPLSGSFASSSEDAGLASPCDIAKRSGSPPLIGVRGSSSSLDGEMSIGGSPAPLGGAAAAAAGDAAVAAAGWACCFGVALCLLVNAPSLGSGERNDESSSVASPADGSSPSSSWPLLLERFI